MTVPFGLTMMTPMRDRPALPELSGAKLDPVTQLGMLDGVPLHAHDGQDPIAMNTEPTYDVQ